MPLYVVETCVLPGDHLKSPLDCLYGLSDLFEQISHLPFVVLVYCSINFLFLYHVID